MLPTRHSFRLAVATGFVACVSLALPAQVVPSPTSDHQWQQVQNLTRRNTFTFITREQTCTTGQIESADDQSIAVKTKSSGTVTIPRENLDRILLYGKPTEARAELTTFYTVYSGRSSWEDVVQLGKCAQEMANIRITAKVGTKDGKRHSDTIRGATDTDITLADPAKEFTIAKADISRLEFVRYKPLSSTQEFYRDELGLLQIFDPDFYPRLFHIGDTMSVRLYDSSTPEDNSPVTCK